MEKIGAFDAKTRWSELLARAAKGESFLITKHGEPMARLVPEDSRRQEAVSAAAERLRSFRGVMKDLSVADLQADRQHQHRF